jgi:hypothetical protein
LFVEQSLADTEAALERLFTSLPEIDIIELTVLDPVSKQKIMAGWFIVAIWKMRAPSRR